MLSRNLLSRNAGAAMRRLCISARPATRVARALPTLVRPSARTFTSSTATRGRGEVDKELSDKIASEIAIENEMKAEEAAAAEDSHGDGVPAGIRDFLDQGVFEVRDTAGHDEVTLVRKFGNEDIKVVFSVSDMNNMEDLDDADLAEDGAGGGSSGSATNGNVARDDGGEDDASPTFPVRCNITIAKSGADKTLSIDAVAQDGVLVVDNMVLYDRALAAEDSAEADWKRREKYMGPPFSNLDEELQILVERYLEERGIDTQLALFIPDYVDYKEAREYEQWLRTLKGFVDA